ncbi:imidazoleglycerol-phosphate dehydratase HisB [Helicobacter sp. 11S02629-2]|uniref:imidazoleglycerol-phosphate dehydratase HisB n=1 Tax=Helicobacter sp. 11S02629-2 TaxID=1476195 RepID=UPI000BA78CC3|nr:imidazoleglycerol-phosphate dehydratase HisB [Helicobacter sp. 11S02629-2]PAF43504.1 imidazoleglycerol-phosphate dehydratase [Helicobacter sp. 11S02629-2]
MTSISRITKETNIELSLEVYGSGQADIKSDVGFLDHMLEALSKHSLMDLSLKCKGDTHIDYHHSTEDIGIVLGKALHDELFPVGKIERYGNAAVVMDEACVECDLDVSNRAFLLFDMKAAENGFFGKVGSFDVELVEEFFRAVSMNSGLSVHLVLKRGKNLHHIIEATFKAFAVALRRAVTVNERVLMPSTKGCL